MQAVATHGSDLDLAQLYEVLESLRRGDFSKRMPTDLSARAGMIARVLNATLDMLDNFKAEQIRVAGEIGTKGDLGCTMEVFAAQGAWQEMIDSVNRMSTGLTVELRRTSQAAERLSRGDTSKPLTPELIGGEVAAMETHINAIAGRITN